MMRETGAEEVGQEEKKGGRRRKKERKGKTK